jgi:hypothetical protein
MHAKRMRLMDRAMRSLRDVYRAASESVRIFGGATEFGATGKSRPDRGHRSGGLLGGWRQLADETNVRILLQH